MPFILMCTYVLFVRASVYVCNIYHVAHFTVLSHAYDGISTVSTLI